MNNFLNPDIIFEVRGPEVVETKNVKPGVYSVKMRMHTALNCPVTALIDGEGYYLETDFTISGALRLGVYKKAKLNNHAKAGIF